ncbi:hypothetical protein [Tunturibacter empetritectus]|nr:hypothetical protein [Edaphobacter lichenicola]
MGRILSFDGGTPENAPAGVVDGFQKKYDPIGVAREAEVIHYAAKDALAYDLAELTDINCC